VELEAKHSFEGKGSVGFSAALPETPGQTLEPEQKIKEFQRQLFTCVAAGYEVLAIASQFISTLYTSARVDSVKIICNLES